MADVKIHSAASKAISPKPAIMTSDHHLLECLICDISTPYEASWLPQIASLSSLIVKCGVALPQVARLYQGDLKALMAAWNLFLTPRRPSARCDVFPGRPRPSPFMS